MSGRTAVSAPYRLIVVTRGAQERKRIYDFAADAVRIGRDPQVEVRLPHVSVSNLHARIERRGGRVFVVDAGSTNGTFVGERRLDPEVPHELGDGDVVTIGDRFHVAFYAESPAGVMLTGPKVTADLAKQLVEDLLATGAAGEFADAGVGPELVGENGAAQGQRYRLPAPDSRVVFGRGQSCDFNLIDPDLSREHFEVRRSWNGASVVDLGSKNGTHLDGQRLVANEPTALGDGARLRAAGCTLKFVDPAARYLAQLEGLVGEGADVVADAGAGGDDAEPGREPDEAPPAGDQAVAPGDRSWAGRVVDHSAADAGGPETDAPPGRGGGGVLTSIVLGVLVIAAVVGLVLLFSS